LHRDQRWSHGMQPFNQLVEAFAVARNGKGLSARPHVHVQAVLRDIDTDIDRVHLDPSLRNRARLAAQATVRGRWNRGRGPALRYGLASPRMKRSPVRHRFGNANRFGVSRLTRMTGMGWSAPREMAAAVALTLGVWLGAGSAASAQPAPDFYRN